MPSNSLISNTNLHRMAPQEKKTGTNYSGTYLNFVRNGGPPKITNHIALMECHFGMG